MDDCLLHIEDKFGLFVNILTDAVEKSFPYKKILCRDSHSARVLWYGDSLRKQREQLNFIYEAYKQHSTESNRTLLGQFRTRYKKSLRDAKVRANSEFIKNSPVTPKAVWSLINAHKNLDTDVNSPDIEPNKLNRAFVGVADRVAEQLPQSKVNPLQFLNFPETFGLFNFKEISFNNVRDIIGSLKNSNSRDVYGLNVTLLRTITDVVLIPLTKLINQCIGEGVFPDPLKIASVLPIYKGGDRDDPLNYRPISILPVISKIFEKSLAKQIMDHFESMHLITANQYGFRSGKSTQDAILKFIDQTLFCFEEKLYSAAVFCDLTKAFDCVSHNILIEKLRAYNFDTRASDLMKSYLNNRSQLVKLKNSQSSLLPVVSGVPQGSILGPVLFLIYINDMERSVSNAHTIFYADDTTFLVSGDSPIEALNRGSELLSEAESWFTANRLALNRSKTNTMLSSLRDLSVVADNHPVRFLGVYLDPDLTWAAHGDSLADSLTRVCYALRQLATRVSTDVMRTAYFALFHTRLSYAILAWGHSAIRHRIFGLQRRAVRIVGGVGYRGECRDCFISLGVLTLPSVYALQCLMYVKQHESCYEIRSDIHGHNTRHKDYLNKPFTRLRKGQTGTTFFGIELFNNLPYEVKRMPISSFKQRVVAYLVRRAFFTFDDIISGLRSGEMIT